MKRLLFAAMLCYIIPAHAISIYDARRAPSGTIVTITGVSLNGSEFGNQRFIDDGTDAICVFGSSMAPVNMGDSIIVSGTIDNYHNLIEIINPNIAVVSIGNQPPEKAFLFPYQAKEPYESRLVELHNVYIENASGTFTGNTAYTLTDGMSSIKLYIKAGTSLVGQPVPTGRMDVTGICAQFDDEYEIFPRTIPDVVPHFLYISSEPVIENITVQSITVSWTVNSNAAMPYLKYGFTPQLEQGIIIGTPIGYLQQVVIPGLSPSQLVYFQPMSILGAPNNDIAKGPTMIGITLSSQLGSTNVYFNRSVNTTVANPAGNIAHYIPYSLDDTIASLINSAQQSIDISIYSFTASGTANIISAINNAHNSGKQVRIIYDGNMTQSGIQQLNSNIPMLASPLQDFNYNISHNKFVIIDAALVSGTVITGSTNFSSGQLYDDANNLVVIRDQSTAKVYTMEFEEMWGNTGSSPDLSKSRFGYYKKDNTPHMIRVGGSYLESYFSPSDNINYHLRKSISSADYSAYIALLLLTKSDLTDSIIQQVNNGTLFAGIINDTSGFSAITAFNNLYNAVGNNVQLYTPQLGNEILHHKYLIADQNTTSDPLVLTGSHNWSFSAENINDENTLIIHDALIANQFFQEFYKRMQDNGITLSSGSVHDKTHFLLYPNPARDFITIVFNDEDKKTVTIRNSTGQFMTTATAHKNLSVDVSTFANGIYFLQSDDGSSVRFVVQR
jgi:phosphatidylserine/phosphatidylglycerophosphate/cardiolipin synthase-like enzyme